MIDKVNLPIWGRYFTLNVDFDVCDDEEVSEEQKVIFKKFVEHKDWIANAKNHVESYCKKSVLEDETNLKKNDIFSYVKPDYIFVTNETKRYIIAIMCMYRYDEEHGLAVIFDDDGNISIGSQDKIL